MHERLRIVAPTALAAVVLLLSACGNGEPALTASTASGSTSDTTTSTSDTAATTSTTSTASSSSAGEELQPVDCGEVTFAGGAIHRLIAEPAANGLVGCTEAVGVIDEFGFALHTEQQAG